MFRTFSWTDQQTDRPMYRSSLPSCHLVWVGLWQVKSKGSCSNIFVDSAVWNTYQSPQLQFVLNNILQGSFGNIKVYSLKRHQMFSEVWKVSVITMLSSANYSVKRNNKLVLLFLLFPKPKKGITAHKSLFEQAQVCNTNINWPISS